MSLVFSDTTAYRGLVQKYEREIGVKRGTVSDNTNLLKEFTADVNLAVDDYISLMIQSSRTWKGDDTNHTDYPEILTNIVSGQRDYTFLTDENGNAILDIFKVYIKDGSQYRLLLPFDADTETEVSNFTDGVTHNGTSRCYDKSANRIRLEYTPTATVTDGLKVSINREGSYFTYSDTTKKPGFPGVHHKYFYLKPALEYARINSLSSYDRIKREIVLLEGDKSLGIDGEIQAYFSERTKDEKPGLRPLYQNNR